MRRWASVAAMLLLAGQATAARAAEWQLNPDKSRLGVTLTRADGAVEARFTGYKAEIAYDPARPEDAKVTLTVDMASLDAGALGLPGDDSFLDTKVHPQARYVLTALQPLGFGRYQAEADLELRGAVLPISHFLDIEAGSDQAHVSGEFELVRTDWGIGEVQDPDGGQIGLDVKVGFDLMLDRVQR